ncbi:MAG: AAA family ATPase [Gemmatimonadota bacterium]
MATFGDLRTEKGSLRHDANLEAITGWEVEHDDGTMTPEEARAGFEKHHIMAVVVTTWSHTPEHPRWRAYGPLSRPHEPSERRRFVAALNGMMGGVLAPESFTLSQSYFVGPPPDGEYKVLLPFDDPEEGRFLDLLDPVELDELAIYPPSTNGDRPHRAVPTAGEGLPDDIAGLLAALSADCSHDEWLRVGMALHHADPEGGLPLWDEWSATSGKYPGRPELDRRWESFGREGENIVTVGTLRHMATKQGYRTPASVADDPITPSPEPLFDPEAIRFGRFMQSEPPAREYLLENGVGGVLPLGVAGALGAMGGAGKSFFIYQAAMAIVTGTPFLGMRVPNPGAVLGLFAEDDETELHRRGRALLSHLSKSARLEGLPFNQRDVEDRLYILSRIAADNLLTKGGENGEVYFTALVDRLIEAASRIPDLRLIVLDPISRFRGGRANHEEDSTRFVEAVEKIREGTGATVLGLAHISQAGIVSGGGQEIIRGSTALVDGFRWVATLQRLRRDRAKDFGLHEDEADRYLRLEIPKSNYTPPFGGMWIRREAGGVMVPTELEEKRETQGRAKAEVTYLDVVARLQTLLREQGPMTRRKIGTRYAGTSGILAAGDHTVRSVIERAIRDGSLFERPGEGGTLLHPPAEGES